jgi:hypothetical protein
MGEVELRELLEVRLNHLEGKIDGLANQISGIAAAHEAHRDRYVDHCERNQVDHMNFAARFAEYKGRNGAMTSINELGFTFWTKIAALFVGLSAAIAVIELLLKRL